MAAGRIAILVLVISVALTAESPPKIVAKVTAPTGAPISHARIQARTSESRITSETESDAQGEAVLRLDPGTSIISVRASGYDRWQYKIDAREKLDNPLIAVLRMQSYYGPTLVNPEPVLVLNTEPLPPIAASIPAEQLAILTALARRKLSHHGWVHPSKD